MTFWTAQTPKGGAGIWGRGGPSIDFEGDVYGATGDAPVDPAAGEYGDSVIHLTRRTLALADYFTAPNWDYITKNDLDMGTSTPVIFRWNRRVLTAVGGKECAVFVNDTASLGGVNHQTAAYTSPRLCNDDQMFEKEGIWGAMSSWQEENGTVWLYVPTWGPIAVNGPAFPVSNGNTPSGRVETFKVIAAPNGAPALQPAWLSPDIAVPEPVAITGGVVFVIGTGENTQQVYNHDIHQLVESRESLKAGHVIVHALDAQTGRELWNSGNTIPEWTHFTGTVVADGKIFAVTHGGGVYAFGLK
jgi:outer membrane protein assembly factor BamB